MPLLALSAREAYAKTRQGTSFLPDDTRVSWALNSYPITSCNKLPEEEYQWMSRKEQAVTESDAKYGRYCGRIAYNILGDIEDTEECVSDTWLRAWNAIPPTIPKILKAFFGKITRNLSLNRLEKEHARKRGSGETGAVLDELAECVADPRAEAWSADSVVLRDTINAFLKDLPAENRRIFIRRYWYMDPVSQIALDERCGESRIKMILLRARKELAKRLMKEGIEI